MHFEDAGGSCPAYVVEAYTGLPPETMVFHEGTACVEESFSDQDSDGTCSWAASATKSYRADGPSGEMTVTHTCDDGLACTHSFHVVFVKQ